MVILGGWRLTRAGILFIVGILVLGGLVTGGIFLVKNHGEAVRRDQAVKVAEQNLKDQSRVATQPVNANSTSSNADSDAAKTNSTTTDTGTSSATNTAVVAGSTAAALPETGIDDVKTLGSTFIVAIFTFSVASYIASRRAARNL